jgi:diguanylate cyclase (GGDEF)-like protein/PAS domain S-box-containing protein
MPSARDCEAAKDDDNADDETPQMAAAFVSLKREHAALKERYEWLETMVNQVPDFIFAKDLDGRFLFANEATVKNNGFQKAADLVGLTDFDIHGAETAKRIAKDERRVMTSGIAELGAEERRVKGDGWLMMSRIPLRNCNGEVIGVVGASRDISARKRAEVLMRAHAAILQDVARGVELRKFFRHATAILQDALPEKGATVILGNKRSRKTSSVVELPIVSSRMGQQGVLLASEVVQEDREIMEFLSSVSRTIAIAIDRDRDAKQISFFADHDNLTGLLNRTALDRKLSAAIKAASSDASPMAIAFVDVDNFKLINDNLGHIAGDVLLKIVAKRLSDHIGDAGLVARIGGDEFIVMLTSKGLPFEETLEKMRELVAQPVTLQGLTLHVTCSIGIARLQRDGKTAAELYANADLALYHAKETGRNCVKTFSSSLAADAREKLVRTEELRKAIEKNELLVHYQPQICARSGQICGVEALVRWQHPTRGLLPPENSSALRKKPG